MNDKSTSLFKVFCIILAVGLALTAASVLIGQAVGGEALVFAHAVEGLLLQPGESAPGIIRGAIDYTGAITGSHLVWVGAFSTTQGGPPLYAFMRNGPGPYTLTIAAAGVYNIMAGMDADDSGGPPNPAVDPIVAYEHNPVTVSAGAAISGVDILLRDPTPPSTGSISGRISYTGHISPSHPIIVFVSRWGEQGPPSYSTVIPGAGFYTITNVAAYTYTVGAFMDLGDDMGPPQAGEPFNWYDPNGDGNPDVVIVRENEPLTAIDIVLHDLLRYIYLPSIHR